MTEKEPYNQIQNPNPFLLTNVYQIMFYFIFLFFKQ